MADENAVVVKELEKHFGSFIAVNRISFEVKKGSIYGILGPNGAGKSTTMRILCGIIEPTGGSATVVGYDIYKESEKIKSHIGYMSQKFSLYEDLTVEENIDFYSGIYRVPEMKKSLRKDWVIRMSELQNHLNTKTGNLPAGWKQQLALGCALLHEPSIIFLDEPTAGVDPISRRNFWQLIYALADKGVTIIVTTHFVEEAEYFDHIGLIYRGELIANGTPEYLKKEIMQDKVLEVICENPQEALLGLQPIPGIKDVGLFGNSLHVVVENVNTAMNNIKEYLEKMRIRLHSIETITPSMEDVFISLIEAYDKKMTAEAKAER